MSGVRIDKWLWAVRLYKTRPQATEACKAGKVKHDGINVKPSKIVQVSEVYTVSGIYLRTIRVKELLDKRVGAKLVPDYMEDLTPEEEKIRGMNIHRKSFEFRERGTGRPTKKQRREIDDFKDWD